MGVVFYPCEVFVMEVAVERAASVDSARPPIMTSVVAPVVEAEVVAYSGAATKAEVMVTFG